MTYANYGKRAIAYILDLLFVVLPAAVATVIGVVMLIPRTSRSLGIALVVIAVFWLLLAGIVNEVIRQGRKGQTIGKEQQGIMLIREDTGLPLGIGFALLRVLIMWFFNVLTGGLYLIADLLAPAFTAKKQRLTDKLLSTVVVERTSVAGLQFAGNATAWAPPVVDDLP